MYHSITFKDGNTEYNTWDDWYLIPSTRPVVSEPTTNYKYVEIPGRNGSLDMSDFLMGSPSVSDRSGSFTFYVDHNSRPSSWTWADHKAHIAQVLNGRRMRMILEDDPNYYYEGRFVLKTWSPQANYSQVTIDYRVGPYKKELGTDEAVVG